MVWNRLTSLLRRPGQSAAPTTELLGFLAREMSDWPVLSAAQQLTLARRTAELVGIKLWEGCAGLLITTEMKMLIAANMARMTLGWPGNPFHFRQSILVYPTTFVAPKTEVLPGGVVIEGQEARLGEAWQRGPVVLAWSEIGPQTAASRSGRNVVIHEFSHVLDMQNGAADGIPDLPASIPLETWQQTLEHERYRLARQSRLRKDRAIDPYGFESPAEFFAVASEAFFEANALLAAESPATHELLTQYYQP